MRCIQGGIKGASSENEVQVESTFYHFKASKFVEPGAFKLVVKLVPPHRLSMPPCSKERWRGVKPAAAVSKAYSFFFPFALFAATHAMPPYATGPASIAVRPEIRRRRRREEHSGRVGKLTRGSTPPSSIILILSQIDSFESTWL